MNNETKWGLIWAAWLATFVVAETKAARSGDPTAPLSHHMRRTLGAASPLGEIAMLGASAWLHRHIFNESIHIDGP